MAPCRDRVAACAWMPTRCAAWTRRRVRVAMKPISTAPRALATVDVATGEAAKAINQRSDVTAVPAAGVVAEAMMALVLADAATEKFGGDSVPEIRRNLRGYLESLVIA